jgi:hypothetical protein
MTSGSCIEPLTTILLRLGRGDRVSTNACRFAALHESAFGPKQTWAVALHMSAFGSKADVRGRFVCPVGIVHWRRRDPISMAYSRLQKQHRSFVPRKTLFK